MKVFDLIKFSILNEFYVSRELGLSALKFTFEEGALAEKMFPIIYYLCKQEFADYPSTRG